MEDVFSDAWDSEIQARLKALDDGRAEAIPIELLRQSMAEQFPHFLVPNLQIGNASVRESLIRNEGN